MLIFYLLFCNVIFRGIIQNWWNIKNLSGILIFGIPIEELMWVFSWGFVAGPTYEFITGLRFKK
jgi:membrane protease YdiL (CAAX protease family)